MATITSSAREAVEERLAEKMAEVSKGTLGDILTLAFRDASAGTLEEINGLLDKALGANTQTRRQALIGDCKITVLGERKVSLTLPEGMSRADFLHKVQPLVREVYGRDVIPPNRLEAWATDMEFTAKPSKYSQTVIAIDGHVAGTTHRTRAEQVLFLDKQRLQMPDLCDLAVAHAAYFLATGKDLFSGDIVRARGGALYFNSSGLHVRNCYGDDYRDRHVAAASSLPI